MAGRKKKESVNFRVYTALLGYPSLNKDKKIVATSITPLSVHDIARVCATYGVKNYIVINPVKSQKDLIKRIRIYWNEGFGSSFNDNRKIALSLIKPVSDLKQAIDHIKRTEGCVPKIICTSAKKFPNTVRYQEMREMILKNEDVFLLIFGTGWGIPDEIMLEADHILEALKGYSDFNHLSVRSAASIILDRLLKKED